MGPLFPRSAAQRQFLIRVDAVVASLLLWGTSHSGDKTASHECGGGGGDLTSAHMLGAGYRHAGGGVPTSGRAAGAAPRAGQVTGVAAAAARTVADGHGDVCPPGAVPTADLAESAAAAATATAAAGCQAASCSALSGGAAALVAAGGGRSVGTPPSSTQWPPGHSAAASDARRRGGGVRWGSQGVPRPGTPPPTNKGRHAVSADTTAATGRRAARGAAPQREDDKRAVTGLGGVVSPPSPPQMPPAGGGMVIATGTGAAFVPSSANAGGHDVKGASVLALAGAEEAAPAICASANSRGYAPSPSAAVGAAWSTGTAATDAAPTAATNRGSNTPGAPLRVAYQPAEAGKGERGVAAAYGGAAPAARQPAPLQSAPVAVAHRAVLRSAATSAVCSKASVGAGARAAVGYAPSPAARSPAPEPRGNAAQRRRLRGVAAVAGRKTAAAPAAATKRR